MSEFTFTDEDEDGNEYSIPMTQDDVVALANEHIEVLRHSAQIEAENAAAEEAKRPPPSMGEVIDDWFAAGKPTD